LAQKESIRDKDDVIMAELSRKQRFLGTLLGDGADRFPFFDLEPSDETIKEWHRQGLPRGRSVPSYFNLEIHYSVGLTIRSYPYYRKASGLLHDPSSFSRYYDPGEPSRFGKNFVKRAERLNRQGHVLYVDASGGGLLQMLGVGDWESLKSACYALIKEPGKVEDLLERTTDFYCLCLKRALSQVRADYASLYEPIASNTGPVVSPAMFERFAIPGYRKVLNLLKDFNVPLRILSTTGGNLGPLLPALIDAGINGLWISNIRSAGMEYEALRRTFGPDLALIGGIDSGILHLDEATMRRKTEKVVVPLLEIGHYLPCLDDRPRVNTTFSQYSLFRRILKEIAASKS
jgi:Uroporphyrinogen decarboxylase (URO-D)